MQTTVCGFVESYDTSGPDCLIITDGGKVGGGTDNEKRVKCKNSRCVPVCAFLFHFASFFRDYYLDTAWWRKKSPGIEETRKGVARHFRALDCSITCWGGALGRREKVRGAKSKRRGWFVQGLCRQGRIMRRAGVCEFR